MTGSYFVLLARKELEVSYAEGREDEDEDDEEEVDDDDEVGECEIALFPFFSRELISDVEFLSFGR